MKKIPHSQYQFDIVDWVVVLLRSAAIQAKQSGQAVAFVYQGICVGRRRDHYGRRRYQCRDEPRGQWRNLFQ